MKNSIEFFAWMRLRRPNACQCVIVIGGWLFERADPFERLETVLLGAEGAKGVRRLRWKGKHNDGHEMERCIETAGRASMQNCQEFFASTRLRRPNVCQCVIVIGGWLFRRACRLTRRRGSPSSRGECSKRLPLSPGKLQRRKCVGPS